MYEYFSGIYIYIYIYNYILYAHGQCYYVTITSVAFFVVRGMPVEMYAQRVAFSSYYNNYILYAHGQCYYVTITSVAFFVVMPVEMYAFFLSSVQL